MEQILKEKVTEALQSLYETGVDEECIQIQKTRKEFKGDFTLVVYPLLKYSKKGPEETGREIGNYILHLLDEVVQFTIVKGFLNFELSRLYWRNFLQEISHEKEYGRKARSENPETIVVEYSSPNTNKPLHLGHIRNNLLGFSMAKILEASGCIVKKVNIVNDRGIHICKSMLAWHKWGRGITPESSGKKGDHLVGDFYVLFEQEYQKQVKELTDKGISSAEAQKRAPLLEEAQEMLVKWEAGDEQVIDLWKMMNQWVYEGFNETYKALGVDFDKIYYESDTYKLGRSIVLDALDKGILVKKSDGSVWAELTSAGLGEKILLRSDGTAVYMTQDLGTAVLRFEDFRFNKHIYVVGNEQNYHFQVLTRILAKLGYAWAEDLFHLSYGMVELPEGKMKSREGTVVDADDLISEMIDTAREMSNELGKLDDFSEKEKEDIYRKIGLGALKYFILKVDPKKNMTFNPKESIDFNGNTGPFIQYTYARIQSVLRNALESGIEISRQINPRVMPNPKEVGLIKNLQDYPGIVNEAATEYNPGLVANFCYELAREYNQFYHDFSILHDDDMHTRDFRIMLSGMTGAVIESAMSLLGIDVPERM